MALTTAQKIDIGKLSEAYVISAIKKGGLYGAGIDSKLPRKIYVIYKALQWMQGLDTSNQYLDLVSNYLIALCSSYGLQANARINGSGGSLTPVIPVSPVYLAAKQFTVDGSSFIPNGDSSKIISDFIGYNIIFVRGGITQSTLTDQSSYYSWDNTTGSFSCTPAAITGELFQIFAII